MNWLSYQDFFSMGGYGLYVWGSFVIFFAALFLEVLSVYWRGRAALKLHCIQQKLSPQRALEQDQAFERVLAATTYRSQASLISYDVLSDMHASEIR